MRPRRPQRTGLSNGIAVIDPCDFGRWGWTYLAVVGIALLLAAPACQDSTVHVSSASADEHSESETQESGTQTALPREASDHGVLQVHPRRINVGPLAADSAVRRTVTVTSERPLEDSDAISAAVDRHSDVSGIAVEVASVMPVDGGAQLEIVFRQHPGTVIRTDHSPKNDADGRPKDMESVPGGPVQFDVMILHGSDVGVIRCRGILVGGEPELSETVRQRE